MYPRQTILRANSVWRRKQGKILKRSENQNACLELWSIKTHMKQTLVYKILRSVFTSARTAWFSLCFRSEDYHVVVISTPTRCRGSWTLHVIEATVWFALWYISVDFGLLSAEVQGVISSLLALGGYLAQNWNITILCYCCCISCNMPT